MKVLFVMRHSGYVRNFESTLRLLCDRGHHVHLAFQAAETHWLLDPTDVSRELAHSYPTFSRGTIPSRDDAWGHAAREVRAELDYLRYLTPRYRQATKLRERAARDVPEPLLRRLEGRWGSSAGRTAIASWLRLLHRAVPTDPRVVAYLEAMRPDVLAVTPLVQPGAPQAEYLRSARALGIRTALCVASWDNLTNKGLIHGPVDLVTVWNEMMKAEAVELHGVPADRVLVTGAQPFDHWFDWRPGTARDAFCQNVGLPVDRPYVLYLCSSKFIAPDEATYVKRWLGELRGSTSSTLKEAGVLIRPHPQNADQWRGVDLRALGPAVVWPADSAPPTSDVTRSEYYDSIYHSAAVVGVNTTAEIESAIVGRGVYTLLAPEFRETQQGTLHFEHLRRAGGGLVQVAESMAQHLDHLDAALRGDHDHDARCRRFVEEFVRPRGLAKPATPRVADALEALAARPALPPERPPFWAPLAWPALMRRGHALAREAAAVFETKAARRIRRRLKGHAAAEADPATATIPAGATRTWKDLAAEYRELAYADRVRFAVATSAAMPAEVQLKAIQPERLDYPHADIYLRVTTKAERKRLQACAKEPFTIDWIHQYVAGGDVLFDIGANVGAYSLIAASKPGGGARVFAFEPSYANAAALCTNVALNRLDGRVTPLPVALSNRDALETFSLRTLESGSARHMLGDGDSPEGPTIYRQPVFTYRLDSLVERLHLPQPAHIKLDVDGGELEVLEGAERTLQSPQLRSVLVEVSTALSQQVSRVLCERGLSLAAKMPVTARTGESLVWYGLFTRGAEPHDGAASALSSR